MSEPTKRVLIAGCGYLGVALARLLRADGWTVLGLTHSTESALALAEQEDISAQAVDLADPAAMAAVAVQGPFRAVVHCASSGRGGEEAYQRVYVEGMANLLRGVPARQHLFTSSTSVYAQVDGGVVTEESPAEPTRGTGRLLRAAEEVALQAGGTVARLAGLYGPGRSVLLRKYLAGEAVIEGDGSRWLNQIHRDDAASALALLLKSDARGVFNVADGTPLTQRELYAGMAAQLEGELPLGAPENHERKRGWTHKQVSPAKLRGLGWAPRYASFLQALREDAELVAQARGEVRRGG